MTCREVRDTRSYRNMNTSALTFDEHAELEALAGLESAIQMYSGQRGGRPAQIFQSFMTPKMHRRLADLRAKSDSKQPELELAKAS